MKLYTVEEAISMIGKKKENNFLAAAITPWHALGIDANIYLLRKRGIELKGYIMVIAHPVTGYAITAKDFTIYEEEDITVIGIIQQDTLDNKENIFLKRWKKYIYYIGAKKLKKDYPEKLYWVIPLMPSYELIPQIDTPDLFKKVEIIVSDEGMASYMKNFRVYCACSFQEGGIKGGILYVYHTLLRNPIFMAALQKNHSIQYGQLLERVSRQWVPNQDLINAYRHCMKTTPIEGNYTYYEGAVIINTDPLCEWGEISKNADIEIYKDICKRMKEKEIRVVLKPHPREQNRERYEGLDCIVEQNYKVAQESVFALLSNKPLCVIGLDTTTLVTSKLLFGIEGISVTRLIESQYLKNKRRFLEFNKTFEKVLLIPKTYDELFESIYNYEVIRERCSGRVSR